MNWPALRRRVAPLLVIAGVGAALLTINPQVPSDRKVAFHLADAPTVTGVEVTWERRPSQSSEEAVPVRSITWQFPVGSAPSVLHQITPLADGAYNLDVTVERGTDRDASRRVVVLGQANSVDISVR
jgi:hypothetical protein